MNTSTTLAIIIVALLLINCVKNDDYYIPNLDCKDPKLTATKTLESLNQQLTDQPAMHTEYDIISGYVVSSDRDKQFTNSLYLIDDTKKFAFKFAAESGGLGHYTTADAGQKVYIKLQNLYVQRKDAILNIGDLHDENIIKLDKILVRSHLIPSCTRVVESSLLLKTTIQQAIATDRYVGQLLDFDEVQFTNDAIGKPYNDDMAYATNRQITDKTGLTLDFRTHKNAAFSTNIIPDKSGSIKGVLTKFGTIYQLVARDERDIQLNADRLHIEAR